jgi:hypothetical protein
MKTRLQITLEDEASNILNQQENKSQYIEDLILKASNADLALEIKRLAMLVDGQINDIQDIKQNIVTVKQKIDGLSSNGRTEAFGASNLGSSPGEPAKIVKGNEFIPKPPDPELGYPCCSGSTPCKHWAFDGLNVVWKNTLTGKTRDA